MDVQKYIKGKCFICSKPCDEEAYCHNHCAWAYWDDKERRIREAVKENNKRSEMKL